MGWVRCGLGTPSEVLSLPTPSEASGAIARFNTDLTENLLSAVAEFSASQASGTPTPSTPIPIVGVDKVIFARTGKNLFDIGWLAATGITVTNGEAVGTSASFNSAFGPNAQGLKNKIPFKPNMQYTLRVKAYNEGTTSTSGNGLWFIIYYTDGTNSRITLSNSDTSYTEQTLTSTSGKTIEYIAISYGSIGSNIWHVKEFQVEQNTEATAYEPYNGTTALINLGGTYFGGSVDAVTGKIMGNKGFYNSLGTNISNVVKDSSSWRIYYSSAIYGTDNQYKEGMCDKLAFKTSYSGVNGNNNSIGFPSSAGTQILIRNDALTTAQEVKDFMATLNVVYPLETPLVVYASNTAEIPTIVGDNQVFCDTGNIAVKYFETVGHKI